MIPLTLQKRIYHPFYKWEDWQNGMWRYTGEVERKMCVYSASILMKSTTDFLEAMRLVITKWFYACEHNLTDSGTNHHAFLGHCACCLAVNSPEDATRQAWHTLNQTQQDWANLAADIAIDEWKLRYYAKASTWNQRADCCPRTYIAGI